MPAENHSYRPLCFIAMPFGRKPDPNGKPIDFDGVYHRLIRPAVEDAGLEPLRADEEVAGGIIHKPMFERLALCEYAVVDLTAVNANVFYELGVRHALRPHATVLLFASDVRLPFDVGMLRAMPYDTDPEGQPDACEATRERLVELLRSAREASTDSPVFQLIEGMQPPQVSHEKTDVFRKQVAYSQQRKAQLEEARAKGVDAVRAVESSLGRLTDEEAGVIVDLFLSYRAVKAWDDMIRLAGRMPAPLRDSVMIQEQLGLALNRAGRRGEAERVLRALIVRRGPSSETNGILGRVYKDQWEDALETGEHALARGCLRRAIDAYLEGFETDWRDAYPGVNAVTLMELQEPPDERREKLIPIVAYAVERRMTAGTPDYWDFATLLELAVIGRDHKGARRHLEDALSAVREPWEPETTARNLRLIRGARERRGEDTDWIADLEQELAKHAG